MASPSTATPAPVRHTDGTVPADELRKRRLLEASLTTFARYGFRKTSMEEVARAAHLSRQGLYLHFATKEELFRATVRYALESAIEAAGVRLRDGRLSLQEKLAGAFDEWIGRYVGLFGADVTDIEEASAQLVGTLIPDHETLFIEAVTKMIRSSGLPAAYKSAGLNARQLADTMYATARGLKHVSRTRAEFGERMQLAIRAMCMPVKER